MLCFCHHYLLESTNARRGRETLEGHRLKTAKTRRADAERTQKAREPPKSNKGQERIEASMNGAELTGVRELSRYRSEFTFKNGMRGGRSQANRKRSI